MTGSASRLAHSRRARLVLPTPMGPSITMNWCGMSGVFMRSALQLEPPDACGRDTSLELGDATESRYLEVRGDIRQRIQNEVALHYPGMREGEIRVGTSFATVDQHVEIDYARAPALALLQTGAPLRSLYRAQA